MTQPTTWLTPREAADVAKVSVPTIRRAFHSGALPGFRIAGGKLIRFRQIDVDQWLRQLNAGGSVIPPRPVALPVNPIDIPAELRAEAHRFCGWRYSLIDDSWKKLPFHLDDPRVAAKVDDPAGFGSCDDALHIYNGGGFDGIGFLLGDGWAGVDLDHCRNAETGELTPFALDTLQRLNSYAEVSLSGTGIKIFVKAWPGKNHARTGLEIYGRLRYFAVTEIHV